MVTQHGFGELQKPPCRIADMPEDKRKIIRWLIKNHVEQKYSYWGSESTKDQGAQFIEQLIDTGEWQIIIDQLPAACTNPEHIQYRIVPVDIL